MLLDPWVTASQSPRAWAATISLMGAGATERRRRGMPVASVDLGRRMGAVCVQKGTRLVKNRVDPGRDARAPVSEPGRRARLLRQGQQSVRGRRESIPTPVRISRGQPSRTACICIYCSYKHMVVNVVHLLAAG